LSWTFGRLADFLKLTLAAYAIHDLIYTDWLAPNSVAEFKTRLAVGKANKAALSARPFIYFSTNTAIKYTRKNCAGLIILLTRKKEFKVLVL
jgi:hypothetical protein